MLFTKREQPSLWEMTVIEYNNCLHGGFNLMQLMKVKLSAQNFLFPFNFSFKVWKLVKTVREVNVI